MSPDDRTLFVADEYLRQITVIDAARAVTDGPSTSDIIGRIPVGADPVGLTFSPDGRTLYATSEFPPPGIGWPAACPAQTDPTGPSRNPRGALYVIDVDTAVSDPSHAVKATIPGGCTSVRVALSPSGDRAYVTARNSGALEVYDTAKLVSDPDHARIASVPVGPAPVGVTTFAGGSRIAVADSNRILGGSDNSTLSIIDAAKVAQGKEAVVATIPTGSFPRELSVTPDGGTLVVTNFNSGTVEFIPLNDSE